MEIDDFGVVCGAMWPNLWPEESQNLVREAMTNARNGSIGTFQAICPTAKGTEKWWDVVVSPLIGADGALGGLISISRDITRVHEAKKREEALAARLKFALDVAQYGEWDLDIPTKTLTCNQQFTRWFGGSDKQLKWQLADLVKHIHPDDRDDFICQLQNTIDNDVVLNMDLKVIWSDNSLHWLRIRGSRSSELPKNSHVSGLLSDVTQSVLNTQSLVQANSIKDQFVTKLSEEVAARTAERDRMWRLSTDIMLVANFECKVVAVNPAWSTQLGHSENVSIGANFLELVHPEDRSATLLEVAKLATGVPTLSFDNRCLSADGRYHYISWSAVPDNFLLHAVGRDITTHKESQEALKKSEAALRQSQKLDSIGKLTGGVAHDFNNVLHVISANLQLLSMSLPHHDAVDKRLVVAMAAVERGGKLSAQLLAFARKHPLQPVVTAIDTLIFKMDELLKRAIGESVSLEITHAKDLWNTLVDPNQLENVLLNLAINASDAMNGEGKLTIEATNTELDAHYCKDDPDIAPGQYVLLAVSDTGGGIPKAILEQIFEPFFTTKAEGEGTGLGLSMAYGFVKQSGGHIKVYSEVGHGTTFKIYLPRSHDEIVDLPLKLSGPVVGGTETILVVEDDLAVQETVVETLKGLGYKVLRADNGRSALSFLENGTHVDLLFTDVVMPGELRSPELARKAKVLLPNLGVLFTSGYTSNDILHGGKLDAGVELLSKPYRREDLARRIRHLFADRQHVISLNDSRNNLTTTESLPLDTSAGVSNVLLVEDNDDARCLTAELLTFIGCSVKAVSTAEEALDYLGDSSISTLLTDMNLPGMSGAELAQKVKVIRPDIDIIFASGMHRPDAGVIGDGDKYLLKPYDIKALQGALGLKPDV